MVTSVFSFYISSLALKIQWLNWWIACQSHLQNAEEALLNSGILETLMILSVYLLAHLSLLTWIKEVGGWKREQQGLENLVINIQSIICRWWYKNYKKCSSVLLYIDTPGWSKSATTNTRNITTLLNVIILLAPIVSLVSLPLNSFSLSEWFWLSQELIYQLLAFAITCLFQLKLHWKVVVSVTLSVLQLFSLHSLGHMAVGIVSCLF